MRPHLSLCSQRVPVHCVHPWTQPFGRLAPCKSALLPICPSTLVPAMLSVAGTRWKHKSSVIFASIGEICGLKPAHRRGRVQLIDATGWYQPLRKNLGKKNCELGEADIERICRVFLDFRETAQSRIFDNVALGFWKVTVERPLRVRGADPERACKAAEIKKLKQENERSEDAPPVIRKIHGQGVRADPLRGLFETSIGGRPTVVEYEPDTDLRDTEQVPLTEQGGIEAFLAREVLPCARDAWYSPDKVKIGYEISFTRHFYKPQPLRSLEQIRADILALEEETGGMLKAILR